MFNSKMMTRAVELLRQRKGQFQEIATECDVSYSWVSKVSQGQLPDAAAGRLERLIAHLESLDEQAASKVAAN